MSNHIRMTRAGLVTAILTTFPRLVFADIGWSVDAGAGHSDNVTLVDTAPVSDTLTSLGGEIAYSLESRRIQAALNGHGNYVHYLDDTYDDDFQGFAAGSLLLGIVSDVFLWAVDDTYGQIAINQYEPITPDNRQNINNFSTGPDLVFRLGSQSDLKFSARYGDARYEESDQIDTQTWKGSISFQRNLSQNTYWGIVASDTRIEYDMPGTLEYDRPAVYATWQSVGARQTLSADLGANSVEGNNETFTKPLVRLEWNRKITPSWAMDVNLGSEYQNTSEQFAGQNVSSDSATPYINVSDVPAANYYGGLSFAFQRPRTRFSLGGGYSQLDYVVDNGGNEDSWYGTMEIGRQFTPGLQGLLSYRVEHRNFDSNSTQDTEKQTAEARLDWRIGKATFLTGGYRNINADSDSAVNTYTSNLFFLTLSYRQGTVTQPRGFAY